MDALAVAIDETSNDEGIELYAESVVGFVKQHTRRWARSLGAVPAIYVHGPGTRVPGLVNALEEQIDIKISEPYLNAVPTISETDHLLCALRAWAAPPLSDPRKIIRKANRVWLRRIIQRCLYGVALLAALIAWSVLQGRQRQEQIDAARERAQIAQADLAAAQSVSPPDPAYLVSGAQEWLQCASTASELNTGDQATAAAPAAIAVPLGYDPSEWPEEWAPVMLENRVAEVAAGLGHGPSVSIGQRDLSVQLADAQQIAASFLAGELVDDAGDGPHDDIDAAFDHAGLDADHWRVFAWAQSHFRTTQSYVPPLIPQLCTASGPDLLWQAQNEALVPVMFSRQMQTYPGWRITQPGTKSETSLTLTQRHRTIEFANVSIFVAWLLHQQDIAETLQPLAFSLWGEDGAVRVTDGLTRKCETGVHAITGNPLELCGSTMSVVLGPRHLIGELAWEALLNEDPEGEAP